MVHGQRSHDVAAAAFALSLLGGCPAAPTNVGKRQSCLLQPMSSVSKHAHPGALLIDVASGPTHLYVAKNALGMRHQRCKAAIGRGHRRQPPRAAIGVGRITLGGLARVVYKTHGYVHLGGITSG